MLSEKTNQKHCEILVNKEHKNFGLLCDTYGEAFYGVIIRIVQKKEESAEIFQDAFTKAWEKSNLFDPEKGR